MQNLLRNKLLEVAIDHSINEIISPLLLLGSDTEVPVNKYNSFDEITTGGRDISCAALKDSFKDIGFSTIEKIQGKIKKTAPNVLAGREGAMSSTEYQEMAADVGGSSFNIYNSQKDEIYDFTIFTKNILTHYSKQAVQKFQNRDANLSAAFCISVFHVTKVFCEVFKNYSTSFLKTSTPDNADSDTFYPYDISPSTLDIEIEDDYYADDPEVKYVADDYNYIPKKYAFKENAKKILDMVDDLDVISGSIESLESAVDIIREIQEAFDLKFDESYRKFYKAITGKDLLILTGTKTKIDYSWIEGTSDVIMNRILAPAQLYLIFKASTVPIEANASQMVKGFKFLGNAMTLFFTFLIASDITDVSRMALRGNHSQIQDFLDGVCSIFSKDILGTTSQNIIDRAWEKMSKSGTEEDLVQFLENLVNSSRSRSEVKEKLNFFCDSLVSVVNEIANYRLENNVRNVLEKVLPSSASEAITMLRNMINNDNMPGSERFDPMGFSIFMLAESFKIGMFLNVPELSAFRDDFNREVDSYMGEEVEFTFTDDREFKELFTDRENLSGDSPEVKNILNINTNDLEDFKRFGEGLTIFLIKMLIKVFCDAMEEVFYNFCIEKVPNLKDMEEKPVMITLDDAQEKLLKSLGIDVTEEENTRGKND